MTQHQASPPEGGAPTQAKHPYVTVVIVNYNGAAFLQGAVDSLARQTYRDFEVILFDNASTDGSGKAADLSALPSASIILHPENIGFAAGNNRAAQLAKGRWLALLNPDTVAKADWLEQLVVAAGSNPEIRTFASTQIDLTTPSLLDGAGDAYLLFGIPWRGGFSRPISELPEAGFCFSACGAAAMYDLQLFLEIGGFDERYFCYCEDVDLGFRLQLAGHDCLFAPTAVIHHAGSGITGRASAFATYHGTRNRVWTYFKNMPFGLLLLTLPVHILLTLYIAARNAFTPRFAPMVRGLRDGILGISSMRRPSPWKVRRRALPISRLASRMAWNPWRMSARKTHIRASKR